MVVSQQAKQLNPGSTVLDAVGFISRQVLRYKTKVQYADEVIVVIKLVPVKASNGEEDKTQVTLFKVTMAIISQKDMISAKD